MRRVSILTIIAFLLSSCSYHGTISRQEIGGPAQTNVGSPRYNTVACIVEGSNDHRIVLDSGCGDTVIDFELCDYLQHGLKGLFAKTLVVSDKQGKGECGLFIYPRQNLECFGEEMIYNFEMKLNDSTGGRQLYAYKTSETGECGKSKPGFMFFSTLLFPPVLGGFFYAMNAHGKSKGNFDAAEVMIRRAINNNISAFSRENIVEPHSSP